MRAVSLATAVALSFAVVQCASAAPITYSVNDSVGAGGVTGTIVTDGALGAISESAILSFDLVLNDGTGTANLDSATGGKVFIGDPDDVTATSTALLFNFDGAGGFLNFFNAATCSPPEWSFETTGSGAACNGTTGMQEGVSAVMPYGAGTYSPGSGTEVFATAGGPTATPEPSSLLLLGSGLAGVLSFARRRPL